MTALLYTLHTNRTYTHAHTHVRIQGTKETTQGQCAASLLYAQHWRSLVPPLSANVRAYMCARVLEFSRGNAQVHVPAVVHMLTYFTYSHRL